MAGTEADAAGRSVVTHVDESGSDHDHVTHDRTAHDVVVSRPLSNTGVPLAPDTAAEVPSAAWGWSGEAPRGFKIAGVIVALCLLAMLHGNQIGHVESIWLIGFAVAILGIVVRDSIRGRRPH